MKYLKCTKLKVPNIKIMKNTQNILDLAVIPKVSIIGDILGNSSASGNLMFTLPLFIKHCHRDAHDDDANDDNDDGND